METLSIFSGSSQGRKGGAQMPKTAGPPKRHAKGKPSNETKIQITYSDLIQLCRVKDLRKKTRRKKRGLAFPCSLKQLRKFLESARLYGCINPFDMAKFIESKLLYSGRPVQIAYSDFIRLCRVKDPKDWSPCTEVRIDGVWIVPPLDDVWLFPGDRGVLSEHPTKDLTKPALAFPCSLEQLQEFLQFLGEESCIDSFDMAYFIQKEIQETEAKEQRSDIPSEIAKEAPSTEQKESIDTTEQGRSTKEAEYVFRKIGPTWEIVFETKRTPGLTDTGWIYIHYLVANPRKKFTSIQLSALDGINPEEIGRKKEIEDFQNTQDESRKPFKDEYLDKLNADRESYIEIIQEAERDNNSERASDYEQKLEELNKVICEYLNSKKPDVEFELKKATQRVGRAIERAVNELKPHNEQAWSHFDQALKPFRSSPHSYHPTTKIPWVL
jgi:hypothetical protein